MRIFLNSAGTAAIMSTSLGEVSRAYFDAILVFALLRLTSLPAPCATISSCSCQGKENKENNWHKRHAYADLYSKSQSLAWSINSFQETLFSLVNFLLSSNPSRSLSFSSLNDVPDALNHALLAAAEAGHLDFFAHVLTLLSYFSLFALLTSHHIILR